MTNIGNRYQEQNCAEFKYGIIEATTRCQLACPGCYMVRRDALNQGQMSLEEAIHILDLCRDYRNGRELETMDILGGEPLLWPYLKPYIVELLNRGIQPWIFTNMIGITPELAKWLYEKRVHITGKMNIANPNDQAQLVLQADMIGRSVKVAREMFDAINIFKEVGYSNPLFRLQNLIRKKNLHLIPDYIRFCRMQDIGVDLELMASGEPIGPKYFKVAPTPQELADLILTLEKQGQDYIRSFACGIEDCFPEFRTPRENLLMPHLFGACPFYDKGLYFAVNGEIRSCSNSTNILANLTDPDPIRKAYESPLICNRKKLTQERVGEPCRSCRKWSECRGGCRATVEGMGDPFGGYALCPLPYLENPAYNSPIESFTSE